MKKSNLKKLFASIAVLSAVSFSAVAAPSSNGKMQGGEGFGCHMQGNCACVMGTVTKVDAEENLVTVKNADGVNVQIHVNPLTVITKMAKPHMARNNDSKKEEAPKMIFLSVSDVQEGDWLLANAFNTETRVVEAKSVCVKMAKRVVDTSNAK